MPTLRVPLAVLAAVPAALLTLWWTASPPPPAPSGEAPRADAVRVVAPPSSWPIGTHDLSTVPDGPLGDAIRRGHTIATRTPEVLPDHVGAALSCSNCHLGAGTVAGAGPWVGVTGMFPEYRSRNARVNTIEDRVNDCFERSLNGTPLDPAGEDMVAIVAYMTWLSRGVPVGTPVEGRGFARLPDPPTPDPERGRQVFAAKCAACHGADGQGTRGPDGRMVFPPLWGEASFNLGAGMARLDTAAAFVHANMPLGQGGTLTAQEAYDVSAFFTTQPRPDFPAKALDWPKGGAPRDRRY